MVEIELILHFDLGIYFFYEQKYNIEESIRGTPTLRYIYFKTYTHILFMFTYTSFFLDKQKHFIQVCILKVYSSQ